MSRLWRFLPLALLALGCGGSQTKPQVAPLPAAAPSTAENASAAQVLVPKPLTESEMSEILSTAQSLIEAGDFASSEDTLEKALLNDATGEFLYHARFNLGVLCERRGAYTEAMRHFDKARGLKPTEGQPLLALARLYARQGQTNTGIELVRESANTNPASTPLRNALNRLLVDNNRELEQVIASSKSILTQEENNADAMFNMAIAYQLQQRHDMALDILKRAEKEFGAPRSDLVWRRAKSLLALEDEAQARIVLIKATESPETATPELHNMLGKIELKLGNYDGAERHFRSAINYSPEMVAACVNLSHALKALRRYDEALSTLNRCSDMTANQVDMLYNLGILYLDGKFTRIKGVQQYERAKSYFEEFGSKSTDEGYRKLAAKYLDESIRKIKKEKKKAQLKAKLEARRKAKAAEEAAKPPSDDANDSDGDDADDSIGDGDEEEEAENDE